MIDHLKAPAAWARLEWLTESEGGRRTAPPTAPVYSSTCAFPLEGEPEVIPGWSENREDFSAMIEKHAVEDNGTCLCALDFLARELVAEKIYRGTKMLVFDGRKIVAVGTVTEVNEQILSSQR